MVKTEEEEFLVCVNGFAILSEFKKGTSFFFYWVCEVGEPEKQVLLLK